MGKPEDYSIIGKRVPPIDGKAKATGEAKFTIDIQLPGMLYGKILRSIYPHARIINIDTEKAKRLRGVRAVITGRDVPKVKFGVFPHRPQTHDQYGLAIEKVRYIGEEVAAVAAVDEWIAQEALELISVDYEELPGVFDPEEAMEPGAPLIHENVEKNASFITGFHFGDVDQGFKEAYYIQEDKFSTQQVTHCALEVHASIGYWDQSGKITVWSSTQSPFKIAHTLSYVLGITLNNIRVIKPFVGGGFGGKADSLFPIDLCAVLLSKKAGRPVKIVNTREEEFSTTRRRHPFIITLKTGVKRDGTLVAIDCKVIADGGAYNSFGPGIVLQAGMQIFRLYRVPNIRYGAHRVYTNKFTSGAMRGFGNLQMGFAVESQLDMIAEYLGIDPLEIRLRNGHHSGDVLSNKGRIISCALDKCILITSEKESWKERVIKMPKDRGMGMSCWVFVVGARSFPYDSSAAIIKVFEDGTVTLITGASDIGQGANTTFAQIVAEELGIGVDDIAVVSGDTEITPWDLGTHASRVTFISGNAIKAAAEDVKKQIFSVVAEELEANVSDLILKDRSIYVIGSPERRMAFSQAVKASLSPKKGEHIIGRGNYNPNTVALNPITLEGHNTPTYAFGAQIVEVKVDRVTGQVDVIRMGEAIDCGIAINPMNVEGQLEGATICGLGQALYENLIMEKGLVMNPSFLEYKVPTALDVSRLKITLVEDPDPEGPFGAKGMAEGCLIAIAPAIANAIYHAVGVRITELPITPEKILKGIEEKEK
jgi:4-hydroxybenzoyl-CoA reductase subunit alpha